MTKPTSPPLEWPRDPPGRGLFRSSSGLRPISQTSLHPRLTFLRPGSHSSRAGEVGTLPVPACVQGCVGRGRREGMMRPLSSRDPPEGMASGGLAPPSSLSAGSGCSPSGRSGHSSPSAAQGLAPEAPAGRSAGPSGCRARTWLPGGSNRSGGGQRVSVGPELATLLRFP